MNTFSIFLVVWAASWTALILDNLTMGFRLRKELRITIPTVFRWVFIGPFFVPATIPIIMVSWLFAPIAFVAYRFSGRKNVLASWYASAVVQERIELHEALSLADAHNIEAKTLTDTVVAIHNVYGSK